MLLRQFTLLFSLLTLLSLKSQAQLNIETQIDAMFKEWRSGGHPGGVIGVMQGDQWIYRKAFGNANLEYDIPFTLDTRINVASVSKSITALCIVKLSLDKKLSLDDDVRKYIDFLPDFENKITIRHLLHHTSGLRSLHGLLEMAGWDSDDPRSTEDLNRLMAQQRELNFAPGEEFLYCNTGYIFMAEIVEKVTGERFENWCAREILRPLGMPHSFIEKDYSEIQKNRATSYLKSGSYFKQAVPNWAYVGSGNMHTTLDDLMNWYGNFMRPTDGWEEAFRILQTKGVLNNGDTLSYAMGIDIDEFMGYTRIQHSGGIGGFRSFACAFPDEELRVIILCNFSSADPMGNVEQISQMLLKEKDLPAEKSPKTYKMKSSQLRHYSGYFYNDKERFTLEIQCTNDTLWIIDKNERFALRPVGKDLFELNVGTRYLMKFEGPGEEFDRMIFGYNQPNAGAFNRFIPVKLNDQIANELTGKYYSSELECTYEIRWEDQELYAWHAHLGKIPIRIINDNVYEANWPLGTLFFSQSHEGPIQFRASNDRVRNVLFVQQPH